VVAQHLVLDARRPLLQKQSQPRRLWHVARHRFAQHACCHCHAVVQQQAQQCMVTAWSCDSGHQQPAAAMRCMSPLLQQLPHDICQAHVDSMHQLAVLVGAPVPPEELIEGGALHRCGTLHKIVHPERVRQLPPAHCMLLGRVLQEGAGSRRAADVGADQQRGLYRLPMRAAGDAENVAAGVQQQFWDVWVRLGAVGAAVRLECWQEAAGAVVHGRGPRGTDGSWAGACRQQQLHCLCIAKEGGNVERGGASL
jgi:hypothetical protein